MFGYDPRGRNLTLACRLCNSMRQGYQIELAEQESRDTPSMMGEATKWKQ